MKDEIIIAKCICGQEISVDENYCFNCGRETDTKNFNKSKVIVKSTTDTHSKTCPYCGANMELGYIKSHNPMSWVEPRQDFFQKSYQITTNGSSFKLISGYQLKSFRCTKCNLIMIDYL